MSSVAFVLVVGLIGVLGKSLGLGDAGTRVNTTERTCFAGLGCFDVGEPWSRQQQVPRPSELKDDTTVVYIYSRVDTDDPYVITAYPGTSIRRLPFDGSLPTVVIIHDHRQSARMEWVHTMKYLYLLNLNSNVLMVDYSEACKGEYAQSVSNARVVGKVISRLLKYLISHKNLQPDRIHLIGHGLGAHVASYVAKDIPGISRLTALDPQRKLFEGYDRRVRLDRTDASFVEVVHTNAIPSKATGGYGMVKPHGHVDFYFNDGGNQPGCLFPPGFPSITTFKDIIDLPAQYINMVNACNQDRAYAYLIEGYNSYSECVFWGHRVTAPPVASSFIPTFGGYILSLLPFNSVDETKLTPCDEENCIPFGYETVQSQVRGVFVVKTRPQRPYCIPEAGLPLEK